MSGRAGARWDIDRILFAVLAIDALAVLALEAAPYFPADGRRVGHDYGWFLPTLLAGHRWWQQNRWWELPHFTPAFCGGVPLLANPQSVVFSVTQLLMHWLSPVAAAYTTLLVSAVVGGVGSFALLRCCFKSSPHAAVLGGVLFATNGFLFYRLVIGHLPYHAFAVVPLLAYAVLSAQDASPSWRSTLGHVVLGGLPVAYLTFGGAMNMQMPALLTVVACLLGLQIQRGVAWRPWLVLGGAFFWGGVLSAGKLIPAGVLASQFPRSYIPQYLFTDPLLVVKLLLEGLFVPSWLPDEVFFGSGRQLNRHEFELGLSLVPPLLVGLAWLRTRCRPAVALRRWLPLAIVLVIPLALTLGSEPWGLLLTRVPIINNNTTFVRWWAIYLLPILVVTARAFDAVARRAGERRVLLVAAAVLAIGQAELHGGAYYQEPANTYDAWPVTQAYLGLERGGAFPDVTEIGQNRTLGPMPYERNAAFLAGYSARPCYEPLFGYSLEMLPDLRLRDGAALSIEGGRFNLVDPSQYFRPGEGTDREYRFPADRSEEAHRFASYRSFDARLPLWYRLTQAVSLAGLGMTPVLLALAVRRPRS